MLDSLSCHRGQAEPVALGEPAEAGTIVLHRQQHATSPAGDFDGYQAGGVGRAGGIAEQVGRHPSQDDRMSLDEYAFGWPYQGQIARPHQALGGGGLVDHLDHVGMAGDRGGVTLGDLQPVLDHV